jgi:subtilisin family serine protease
VFPPLPDPYLTEDYAMKRIGATEVWKTDRGTKRFIVADIDSGIDYTHEDLASNLWRAKDSSGKETIGYDFIHNDDLPYDDLSHGTHTAGLIGAVGGNGVGISGVMQRVSIMALKFISSEGVGTTAGAIRAIDFAIAHGAKVLNNSWGQSADEDNPALREAIERAKAADVLFVAAAGNYSADNDGPSGTYPAAFDNDNLISVAASDKWDRLSFFSNFGEKSVHLAAPGDRIYSTLPHNKYREESGTSMACPLVSGAVALLWSKHPAWNYRKVKLVLLKNVDPLPTLQGKTITGGRLNVLKALRSTGD